MTKQIIKTIIARRTETDGLIETGVPGVRLFRASTPIPCAPAIYEPSIIAIVGGAKEAVLDGKRFVYDDSRYLCCPVSMPLQAGTPNAAPDNPLLGVYITLNPRVLTELILEMDAAGARVAPHGAKPPEQGIAFANWDPAFADALLRLIELAADPVAAAVLGQSRLRELYYAFLQGEAGQFARHAFGAGNAISRSIHHVSAHLDDPISIDDMASRAGMSRAVFHRKFKEATTMSPIQFVKSMRLGSAAMKIAEGMTVNEAAMQVGYVSPSQFSREFKRSYGQSPRDWSQTHQVPTGMT